MGWKIGVCPKCEGSMFSEFADYVCLACGTRVPRYILGSTNGSEANKLAARYINARR